MTAQTDPGPIRTILIDADGRPTDDPSRAVRGEVVEVAPDGSIIADYPSLAWSVDPGSLEGNEGQLATRPQRAAAEQAATVTRPSLRAPGLHLGGNRITASVAISLHEPPGRPRHTRRLAERSGPARSVVTLRHKEESDMNDEALQEDVLEELKWDPEVDAAHIGVAVKDGAVTLSGHVSSYAEKWAAVKAAERVEGVVAVADEIKVKLPSSSVRDDSDIAESIAEGFRSHVSIPDSVEAEVRNGLVTLRGEVTWSYQREAAERVARNTVGVKGVSNLITVKPSVKPEQIEQRIASAIRRMANLDADQITVTTTNGTVQLRGRVHSWYEKQLAEREAKSAPGVTRVDNEIAVVPA
jgi:osmotically-inducible protein OsmY